MSEKADLYDAWTGSIHKMECLQNEILLAEGVSEVELEFRGINNNTGYAVFRTRYESTKARNIDSRKLNWHRNYVANAVKRTGLCFFSEKMEELKDGIRFAVMLDASFTGVKHRS